MKNDPRCLAIIPARGGSKRIPHKNIKEFLGEPIIQKVIGVVKASKVFHEIMVSTDSEEIKSIALANEVQAPFLRSQKNSDDHAPLQDVIFEVLEYYRLQGLHFDFFCCILPTSVLLKKERLVSSFETLRENDSVDGVMPVCAYSSSIWRSFKIENDSLKLNWPQNYLKRSQDFPQAYYDSGQFYFVKVDRFLNQKTFMLENLSPILINEDETQDIDTLADWKLAEMKYQLNNKSII